jgi:hypothetical protein
VKIEHKEFDDLKEKKLLLGVQCNLNFVTTLQPKNDAQSMNL